SQAPYANDHLARECGLAVRYSGVTDPSLPNYIAATSGASVDRLVGARLIDDKPPTAHPLPWASLFAQVKTAGLQWRAYDESMTSNCALDGQGSYASRHNPATYYTHIRADCLKWDVPLAVLAAGDVCGALAGS